ncbi:MAG: hypothetical protein OXI20_10460 [Rhodospirillales bacterium]|nr:hypothetical protein [Rhodospirillales bacterium]
MDKPKTPTHLRMLPDTAPLWAELRTVIVNEAAAHDLWIAKLNKLPPRFKGEMTNAAVLHIAVWTALNSLDPGKTHREVLHPPSDAAALKTASDEELLAECEGLRSRFETVMDELESRIGADDS